MPDLSHRPTQRPVRGWLSCGIALLGLAFPTSAQDGANYDESKVPAYELPDPLLSLSGKRITDASEWPERRKEILGLFESEVYGRVPASAKGATFAPEPGLSVPDFLDGRATLREIALVHGPHRIHLLLITPNDAPGPVPCILGPNFAGNHTIHPDPRISLPAGWVPEDRDGHVVDHRASDKSRGGAASRWPVATIIDRGYALATFYCGDVDPDFDDRFANGVHATFGKPAPDEWGSIASWAWGLGRALDHLIEDPAIDGGRIAVFGWSRLGKCALWAAAVDERFALVLANESGCGGAALSRRAYGETVKRINTRFPHWFSDNFQRYNDNEAALPVDQHMLLALVAPRPVHLGCAVDDRWADPRGEFLAAKEAEPVYALFGKPGLGVDELPEIESPVGERIRYHIRRGRHDVTDYDWACYLDSADARFSK